MAGLSRVQKYKQLRDHLQNDTANDISTKDLKPFESRLSQIDANNFAAPKETGDEHAAVHARERREVTPTVAPKSQPKVVKPPFEEVIDRNENDSTFDNDYLDQYIREVKQYNIEQGNAFSDDTQINVLRQIQRNREIPTFNFGNEPVQEQPVLKRNQQRTGQLPVQEPVDESAPQPVKPEIHPVSLLDTEQFAAIDETPVENPAPVVVQPVVQPKPVEYTQPVVQPKPVEKTQPVVQPQPTVEPEVAEEETDFELPVRDPEPTRSFGSVKNRFPEIEDLFEATTQMQIQQTSEKEEPKQPVVPEEPKPVQPTVARVAPTPARSSVESRPVSAPVQAMPTSRRTFTEDLFENDEEYNENPQNLTKEDIMAEVQNLMKEASEPSTPKTSTRSISQESVGYDPHFDASRTAQQQLLNETTQMRAQLDDYEDNLNEVSDKMQHTNKILNIVLVVLIIALAIILGIVIYWIIISRGA